jgi:hypothetical protein
MGTQMIKLYEKANGTFGQSLTVSGATAAALAPALKIIPGVNRGFLMFYSLSRPYSDIQEIVFTNAPRVSANNAANVAALQDMMDNPVDEDAFIVWKPLPAEGEPTGEGG